MTSISGHYWAVNVRKSVVKANHLDDLVKLGTLTREASGFLQAAVAAGLNILVARGTRTGAKRRICAATT